MVIHDVSSSTPEHTIVHIENGHVSGRKVGDGASQVVLEQLEHQARRAAQGPPVLPDPDAGRQDPQVLVAVHPQQPRRVVRHLLHQLRRDGDDDDAPGAGRAAVLTRDKEQTEPEKIINVNDVLDELIQQSVALVGKPAALMNKDDKVGPSAF